jgi:hypothetical protein
VSIGHQLLVEARDADLLPNEAAVPQPVRKQDVCKEKKKKKNSK